MALTTFVSGQVLTAAQLNDSYAAVGGLRPITSASFTTQTSVSLPNSTFTSSYQNYLLMFDLTAVATGTGDVTLRFRASGTDDSNANYNYGFAGPAFGSGATATFNAASATSFKVGEINSSYAQRYALQLNVIRPQTATQSIIQGQASVMNTAGTVAFVMSGGGVFAATTQFDALTIISSLASAMTGSYRVYAYSNS